jgi:hypothetical protein
MYPVPQNLESGSITVGTSAVRLTSVMPLVNYDLAHGLCVVKALSTNTGIVYV